MFGKNFEVNHAKPLKSNDQGPVPGSSLEPIPEVTLGKYETEESFNQAVERMGTDIEQITADDFVWDSERKNKWTEFVNKHKAGLRRLGLTFLGMFMTSSTAAALEHKQASSLTDADTSHTWNIKETGHNYDANKGAVKFNPLEGGGGEPEDPIVVDVSKYFKTGTFEYENPSDRMDAVSFLTDQLDKMDFINSDIFEVVIEGSASGDRSTGDSKLDNPALARGRAEEGSNVFVDALMASKKYTKEEKQRIIAGMKVEAIVKFLTPEEKVKLDPIKRKLLMDAHQGAKVIIRAKIEKRTYDENKDFGGFGTIIADQSKSMTVHSGQVLLAADEINANREPGERINTIRLEGGDNEQHLQTLIHYLEGDGANVKGNIFLITDEGVNQLKGEKGDAYNKRYKAEIDRVLELAGDREIIIKFINPKQRTPGEKNYVRYLIFNLKDKPFALQRQARPDDASGETPAYAEEKLNVDCFNKIERYQDKGDSPEQEQVSDDKSFHGLKGN